MSTETPRILNTLQFETPPSEREIQIMRETPVVLAELSHTAAQACLPAERDELSGEVTFKPTSHTPWLTKESANGTYEKLPEEQQKQYRLMGTMLMMGLMKFNQAFSGSWTKQECFGALKRMAHDARVTAELSALEPCGEGVVWPPRSDDPRNWYTFLEEGKEPELRYVEPVYSHLSPLYHQRYAKVGGFVYCNYEAQSPRRLQRMDETIASAALVFYSRSDLNTWVETEFWADSKQVQQKKELGEYNAEFIGRGVTVAAQQTVMEATIRGLSALGRVVRILGSATEVQQKYLSLPNTRNMGAE